MPDKKISKTSLLSNISYTLISNMISMGLGAAAILILPKWLSVDQYGYYQLYQFYVAYCTLLALGIPEGIYLLQGSKVNKEVSPRRIKSCFLFTCLLDSVFFLLIVIWAFAFVEDTNLLLVAVAVGLSGAICCPRLIVFYNLLTIGSVKRYAFSLIIEKIVALIPVLGCVLLGADSIVPLLFCDTLGRLCALIFASTGVDFLKTSVKLLPKSDFMRGVPELIKSGSQILVSRYTDTLITGILRWVVQLAWGVASFAHLSLTISIVNMFMRLADAVATPIFPALASFSKDEDLRFYRTISFGITLIIAIGALLLVPIVFLLTIWLPLYVEALSYVLLLIPMCLAQCKISILVSNYYKSFRMEHVLMLVNIASIGLSIVTGFISVYCLNNLFYALLCVDMVAFLRLVVLEIVLKHARTLPDGKMILCDSCLVIAALILYALGGFVGILVYVCLVGVICIINRWALSEIIQHICALQRRSSTGNN